MMCGTTPTHTFTLPFSVNEIKSVRIIYAQGSKPLFVKEKGDCTLENNVITVKLTQEDTLLFDYKKRVEIQVRVLTTDDDSIISTIKSISVGRCLEKEVII